MDTQTKLTEPEFWTILKTPAWTPEKGMISHVAGDGHCTVFSMGPQFAIDQVVTWDYKEYHILGGMVAFAKPPASGEIIKIYAHYR